jgi:hypothetical protein
MPTPERQEDEWQAVSELRWFDLTTVNPEFWNDLFVVFSGPLVIQWKFESDLRGAICLCKKWQTVVRYQAVAQRVWINLKAYLKDGSILFHV